MCAGCATSFGAPTNLSVTFTFPLASVKVAVPDSLDSFSSARFIKTSEALAEGIAEVLAEGEAVTFGAVDVGELCCLLKNIVYPRKITANTTIPKIRFLAINLIML